LIHFGCDFPTSCRTTGISLFADVGGQMRSLAILVGVAAISSAQAAQAQQCPAQGDARQKLAKTLNVHKNREDAPTPDKFNPSATLSTVLAAGPDLDRWSREDAAVFEGIVIDVKVGGIETANCHAKNPADRDTHIELAVDSSAVETQRVVVAVTPRWRAKMQAQGIDWSTSALKSALIGKRVRATGWMLDDLEHTSQAENTNPHGASNWRATVWEIHPVTQLAVLPTVAPQTYAAHLTEVDPSLSIKRPARAHPKCAPGARWIAKQHICRWTLPTTKFEDR
jgi:hypothetical protein